MRRRAFQFDRVVQAEFVGGCAPTTVRMSTAVKKLRDQGLDEAADALIADAQKAAPWCPGCERKLDDPVIGLTHGRVAFACPHCSGPDILAQWEAEGRAAALALVKPQA